MELSEAYQVLSDAELRNIYDQNGAEAAKQRQAQNNNGQRSGDPMDLFRQFFGGGGASDDTPKGPQQNYNAELALSDVYTGRTFSLDHTRPIICPSCYGSGAESRKDIHTCTTCRGQGVQIVRQQLMPGFTTNMQVPCQACGGKGKTIQRVCPQCHGEKTIMDTTEIDVDVEAGAREGQEYLFEGMAQQSPDFEPGDVLVTVHTKTEPGDYRRIGHNLYYTLPISLKDALFGLEIEVQHYDGHTFTLRRDQPTQPNFVHRIPNEGMPIPEAEREHMQSKTFGDMFVTYKVIIPKLDSRKARSVADALGVDLQNWHTDL
ncbi:DnaJ- protein scj1 [Malassezia yamatoensis]|uniref:DnaJ- protein scj1 n=1 Tax=Malassezia yamatoensis TaxID=253288 RepID=A0AAJ5YWL7_9BASI|nr:DnaJ- protein scj1 [Malassezia yamatoensis]